MPDQPATPRVLIVTTSANQYKKAGYRTGLWLGELTHFYDVVERAGCDITIASIDGGQVPLDPESLGHLILKQGGTQERYQDPAFMARLDESVKLADVAGQSFDAVYLTGGHGTMFDFPTNPELGALLTRTFEAGGIVSAVCHGPAGLLAAKLSDGTELVRGRKVTGFSWPEEKLASRDDVVPFRLDEALKDQGAKYTKAVRPMAKKVVRDGSLITGQNPMSAEGVGEAVVKALSKR